jgi:hypothetical protein
MTKLRVNALGLWLSKQGLALLQLKKSVLERR